jgi:hypothetical protein
MNILNFMKKYLTQKSPTVTPAQITAAQTNPFDQKLLRNFGFIQSDLRAELNKQSLIQFERSSLYTTLDRSLVHPLMSAAVGLFADVATNFNRINNATVWVETESKEYKYQIEKLFDVINIEENIYDWAYSTCHLGDTFIRVFGEPGVGIVHIDDGAHPIDVSRLDYNSRLCGFYNTPQGYFTSQQAPLLAPWEYVHMRLLGSKKRRMSGNAGNEQYSEYRTVSVMTPDSRRITNHYGASILADALPIWKRLRLAEDSVMMARITRGVLRYIYKVAVDKGANSDSVLEMLDGYISELKRARSLDTTSGNFQDRFNAPAGMEDIILPVWGEVGNLTVEKIGGEVDIKWIADIEELQRQLSTALKIPLPLLAGYADKAGGFEQGSALEKLDIRFARQARRIQRSLINGITRLVQIHLSYQGINPDLTLFKIRMSETSTAEEKEIVDSLSISTDVATKVFQLYDDAIGVDLDKKQLLEFLNNKILKLTDIEIEKLLLKGNKDAYKPATEEPLPNEPNPFRESIGMDLKSALPLDKKEVEKVNESTGVTEKVVVGYENLNWNKNWGGKTVTIKEIKQKGKK